MTLASALCAGMLAGCGSSASTGSTGDSGSTASGDAYNVTVIVKHTDGHFNKVIAGARAYGSEHDNVNVEIQSPTSATSYDEQVNMIETALGNPGIDAVVIAPQQSTSTATLVDTATKPVVALDTDFTSDKKACFVGTGTEDAALNGGKAVAEACKALGKDKPTAVIIAGVQGDETHEARLRGYRDAIEAAGGQVLEVQYTDTMPDKAAAAMEAVIQKYPNGVDAVLSIADDMALAAAKVIKDSEINKKVVSLGSQVTIKDMETEEEEEYTVVGTTEADPMADPPRISNESPVGKAILGQKVGSVCKVPTPAGELSYKIVSIAKPSAGKKKKAAAKE